MNFYTLTNDHLFKRIFTEEKYLKLLLSDLFGVKARHISYLNPELIKSNEYQKAGIVDLLLEADNDIVILELQNIDEHNFKERLLYYSSGVIYTRCLGKSKDFCNLKKIKVYAILNYSLFDDSDDDGVYLTRKNQLFSENLEYKIFDLTKIDENNKNSNNYELVNLFKTTDLNKLKEIIKNKEYKEILEKMEIYNQSKEEYQKMEDIYKMMMEEKVNFSGVYEDALEEGISKGIRRGIKRGEKNKTIAIAKNLLKQNVDINTIATATNLSVKEINSLR